MSILLSFETLTSSYLSDLYLWLSAFMIGDLAVFDDGFGKLRDGDTFVGFWTAFKYLVIGVAIAVGITEFVSPYLQTFIFSHFEYSIGMTSFMLGTFLLWVVYAFDFDIKTQGKWLFAVVCYIIAVLNIVIPNYI
jgi:hypothetical protein